MVHLKEKLKIHKTLIKRKSPQSLMKGLKTTLIQGLISYDPAKLELKIGQLTKVCYKVIRN